MGRPSVTEQRRKEVLDAFVRCVAKYGLHGATLERLASDSGLKRPLIRHHLGNREAMMEALVVHVVERFRQQNIALLDYLESKDRIATLLDILFHDNTGTDDDLILAFAALTAHAAQDTATREMLLGSLVEFETLLRDELKMAFPHINDNRISATSQMIMALYFNLDALSPLQPPQEWRDSSRQAVSLFIHSLDKEEH